MTKGKATREYQITFRRTEDEAAEETRVVRAADPDQAKRKLEAESDLVAVELEIIDIKAIPGTKLEPGAEADQEKPAAAAARPAAEPSREQRQSNRIAELLHSAEEFKDGDDEADDDGTHDPPEELAGPIETGPSKLTRDEWKVLRECAGLDENDADNGKRLLKWFGGKILNIQEAGWHVWTGTHWDGEQGQHAVERFAHLVVQRIKREAALLEFSKVEADFLAEVQNQIEGLEAGDYVPVELRKKMKQAEELQKQLGKKKSQRFNFGIRAGDRSRTKAMIDQAEPHRTVMPAALDQDDFAINCLNGTVRISMLEESDSDPEEPSFKPVAVLDPHNPDDLFTKVAAAEYIPGSKAPTFMKDMARFMPDANMREFLQVFMGYVSLGVTGEQVYAFFYGDGANWKSAFLQTIARTLGGYYKPMNYTSVSGNNMPTGDKPSPDWARLSGVRFLTIEEVPRKEPIKEELVKLVTSGTPMPVRHLNKGMFDLVTKFTCVMTSNGEPNISGHDRGIWRRTLIVPWDVTIPENERLPFDQVMATYDRERAGILAWLVEGACKYRENGLHPYITQRMREFTDSVRADRDAAGSFIEDCIEDAPGEHVTSGDLYRAFVQYCRANGIDPILNSTAFGRQVKRVDVAGRNMERRKHKVQGVRRFNDIRLHDVPPAGDSSGRPFAPQWEPEP